MIASGDRNTDTRRATRIARPACSSPSSPNVVYKLFSRSEVFTSGTIEPGNRPTAFSE
jgi:hypothetical protein